MCDQTSLVGMAEVPQCPTDPVRGLSLRQTEHMDENLPGGVANAGQVTRQDDAVLRPSNPCRRCRSGSGGLISIVADCRQVQVVGHGSDQVRHFIGGISESDVVEYGNSLGGDAVSSVLFVKNALSHL